MSVRNCKATLIDECMDVSIFGILTKDKEIRRLLFEAQEQNCEVKGVGDFRKGYKTFFYYFVGVRKYVGIFSWGAKLFCLKNICVK